MSELVPGESIAENPRVGPGESYKVDDGPLFVGEELPFNGDIRQGKLGDCALLASLDAVLLADGGPKYIRSMFKETSECVTVTFNYRVKGDGEDEVGEWTKLPITMDRNVPQDKSGDDILSPGPLWVKMIEKAYTIFLHQVPNGRDNAYAEWKNGVNAEGCFSAILGPNLLDANVTQLGVNPLLNKLLSIKKESQEFKAAINTLNNSFALNHPWRDSNIAELKDKFFGDDTEAFENWVSFNTRAQNQHGGKYAFKKTDIKYNQLPSLDVIKKWLKKSKRQCGLTDATIKKVLDSHQIQGKVLSGEYTDRQLELVDKIKVALHAKEPVVVETPDKYENSDPKLKGPEGTKSSYGIFAKHNYSVVKIEQIGDVWWVDVRNPHGQDGRKWNTKLVRKPRTVVGDKHAVSRLPLADFVATFEKMTIGTVKTLLNTEL